MTRKRVGSLAVLTGGCVWGVWGEALSTENLRLVFKDPSGKEGGKTQTLLQDTRMNV